MNGWMIAMPVLLCAVVNRSYTMLYKRGDREIAKGKNDGMLSRAQSLTRSVASDGTAMLLISFLLLLDSQEYHVDMHVGECSNDHARKTSMASFVLSPFSISNPYVHTLTAHAVLAALLAS